MIFRDSSSHTLTHKHTHTNKSKSLSKVFNKNVNDMQSLKNNLIPLIVFFGHIIASEGDSTTWQTSLVTIPRLQNKDFVIVQDQEITAGAELAVYEDSSICE